MRDWIGCGKCCGHIVARCQYCGAVAIVTVFSGRAGLQCLYVLAVDTGVGQGGR
jgi:hypothetical protein